MIFAILAIVAACVVATIVLSAIRVGVLLSGNASAAEISAALTSSAVGAVSVVFVVTTSAALTLCTAIASPLARLAESFEPGGRARGAPRLRDLARLQAGMRRRVAEIRSEERDAAAERERALLGELSIAQRSAADADARERALTPVAEALARVARGDLTVGIAEMREAHPLRPKLDQMVALMAKTVLAFSASLYAIRSGAQEMNASVEAYADEISKLTARTEAAQGALFKRCEVAAELATPLGASALLLRALADDVVVQGGGVRRGRATFGEIRLAAERIAPILTLVDEVAFQTNMLALNAGVEAARVGDAGRGMGVVAQELRGLAQSATQAAKQSSALLARVLAEAERGSSELSTVEAAHDALPGHAAKILAVLERTGLELAEQKPHRENSGALFELSAAAAAARERLKDETGRDAEALESLIGGLSALTGRFKLEADDALGFRPPPGRSSVFEELRGLPMPAPRRAQQAWGRQKSS